MHLGKNMKKIFITGVDTDIGKTFVSLGLALGAQNKGVKVGYFKPFQSGAYENDGKLVAPDPNEFKKFSNIKTKYSYLFKGEVSPHLATIIDNIEVDMNKVKSDLEDFSKELDLVIVEGAGGLYCPAVRGKLFKDIISELNMETLIVSTPTLGRLNHLLMTIECAKLNNIKLKGIIINKMPCHPTLSEKNFIKEFKMFSKIPILAVIPEIIKPTKEGIIESFKDINL